MKYRLSLAPILVAIFACGCTGAGPRDGSTTADATVKISPELTAVAQQLDAGVSPAKFAQGPVHADTQGRIQVYVHMAQVTNDELTSLTSRGLVNALSSPALHVIQGWVKPQDLNALVGLPFVTMITPPVYGYPQG